MAFVYSCCFWFSLRLGGIIIGILSLLQALLVLAVCSLAHSRSQDVKDEIAIWINNLNLIYTKEYLETLKEDPEKYINFGICITCIYIAICVTFIYGAYTCNNVLMVAFILTELVRLTILSILIATCLLILKQNTMDIGLLIGASVASGFFLLGMFYLWVCAANLPLLINEMERDDQAATIRKLQQMLESKPTTKFPPALDTVPFAGDSPEPYRRNVFMVPKNINGNTNKPFVVGSRIPMPY